MSKFLDLTGLTQLVNKLNALFDKKVDKVTGKGLSTNDYTTAEKEKLAGIAEGANKYTHPDSGVGAGTYRSVTVNKQGHVTAGTNPTTLEGYGITEVEAEKITGTINIANLPQGALERCVVVENDEARFALTSDNVQTGDTVKVKGEDDADPGTMYFVKDDTKLSSEDGYEIYTAGNAISATSDSKGQNIASTYIKDVSLMGRSPVLGSDGLSDAGYEYLKITKGDNSTSDIKFNTFTTDKNGLVPAPLASTSAKFLRDDGTWVAPNFLSLDGGTMAGDIDMNNYNITGAMNIIAHGNIATDGIIATNGGKINTAGGDINTLSGNINTLGGDIFLGVTNNDTKGSISGVDTVTANSFIGNLQGNATSATSDSEGQNIAETYVKEIGLTTLKDSIGLGGSGSDYSILVTKGDGTDYKVNIPLFTSTRDGLVPSPGASNTTKYLRGDGTWATPANTDTKVTNTLNTTSKAYITGTTSNTTNTGTQIFNTDHYIQGESLYSISVVPDRIANIDGNQYILMGIKNDDNVVTNHIVIGSFGSSSNSPFIQSGYEPVLNSSYIYSDTRQRIHFSDDVYGGDLVTHSNTGVTEISRHWAIHQDGAASFNSIIVGGHIEYGKPGEDGLVIDQSNIYRAPLNSEIEANIHMSWENVHMYGAGAVAMYTGGTLDHDNPKAEGNSYIYLDGSMGNIDIHSDGGADIDISGESGAISITSNEDFRVDAKGMYLTSTGTMEFKGNSKFKNSNGTIMIQVNNNDSVKLRNSQGTNLTVTGTGIVSELESHTFSNKNGGDVSLILDRGTKSNFKIINDGALHFQTDYTSTKGEYFDVLSINNNNGNATFKGTVTAPKFIGSLTGNATSASTVPWSGVTGVEYATEEDILALFE